MVNTLERLVRKDPTLTTLDLGNLDGSRTFIFTPRGKAIRQVLQYLHDNVTLTNVHVVMRAFHNLSEPERMEVFRAVGKLPNLRELRITTSGLTGLSLDLINATISEVPEDAKLQSLTLESVHYRGKVFYTTKGAEIGELNTNDADYKEFLHLLNIKLSNSLTSFALLSAEDYFDLNPLVYTLAVMPLLSRVTLQAHSGTQRRLTRDAVELLLTSKSIECLELKRLLLAPVLPEVITELEDNSTLQELNLEQNQLDEPCGMALAYVLGTNTTLVSLKLSYNMLSDECTSAMVGSLVNNPSLTALELGTNNLGLRTCQRLAHLLVGNDSVLQHLRLSSNILLGDDGIAMIAFALGQNSTLESLDLTSTGMTSASIGVLASSLETNTTLRRLNLAGNRVMDDGAGAMANALEKNCTLESLTLVSCQVGDAGAERLAGSLARNSSLVQLNLRNNTKLTVASFQAMESMLYHNNYTVKWLWMPSNVQMLIPTQVSSFLKMNRIGRKELLLELDNEKRWLEALFSSGDDMQCLYFFLRSNPTVVEWFNS